MTTLPLRNSINWPPLRLAFLLTLACICIGLAPALQAVSPAPDGAYSGANTAEGGSGTLFSLTTGTNNTALGSQALDSVTTGSQNTATGAQALKNNTASGNTADGFQALVRNTIGSENTATGWRALYSNTTGHGNSANGAFALYSNTTGGGNSANGVFALFSNNTGGNNAASGGYALHSNTTGFDNTANGYRALFSNTTGGDNTANGVAALEFSTTGYENTATGVEALGGNSTGYENTADGYQALVNNNAGTGNTALGFQAGFNILSTNNNIDIGNQGVSSDSDTIRIGDSSVQTAAFIAGISGVAVTGTTVVVNASGQLGVATSSERFKEEVKPMHKTSEAILALKPVTFRYKKEIDADRTTQFGLVAEDVEKVDPDLVARDKEGKPFTVRYEAVNAMLLNEFLKEHCKVEQQEATIAHLKSALTKQEATIAEQQKGFESKIAHQQTQIEALTAGLQRVSAQVEMSRPAPQMVLNNQ